ncbi:MAG: hypothetical protein ABIY55_11450 [Kofleriaceae bacterium]
MPRSSAQSDFTVVRAPDPVVLPAAAGPVTLPRAELRTTEASALATRWVMRATFAMLFALLVLCMVGLHIPSGG